MTSNKTQNCDSEIVSLVKSNFEFYRDDWPASKKLQRNHYVLRTVLGGGACAVLVGAGEWAPPPAPALLFRREMTKNMAI